MTAGPPPSQVDQAIDAAWRRLPHELGRGRLESLFAPVPPAPVIELLLSTPRLERRLADRVAARLALTRPSAEDFSDPPRRIVLAGRDALETTIRVAGAVRHRNRIRPLVLRDDRAAVSAAIGDDAFAAAQSCRGETPPATTEWTADELIAACRRDGPVCLASWLRVLPEAVAAWITALVPSLDGITVPDHPDREIVDVATLSASLVLAGRHD